MMEAGDGSEGEQRQADRGQRRGEAVGISESQAHVIVSRAEIKPHRSEYWVMTDFDQPYFEQRCSEVCGLYLGPAGERAGALDR